MSVVKCWARVVRLSKSINILTGSALCNITDVNVNGHCTATGFLKRLNGYCGISDDSMAVVYFNHSNQQVIQMKPQNT